MTIEEFLKATKKYRSCSVKSKVGYYRFRVLVNADYDCCEPTIYLIPLYPLEEGVDGSVKGSLGRIVDAVESFYNRDQEMSCKGSVKFIHPDTNKPVDFKILKDLNDNECLFVWDK